MERRAKALQERARKALEHVARYEERVFIDYVATEDVYALGAGSTSKMSG